jgi:hypothetical protein
MKKIVRVVIEKEYEIELKDFLLTQESVSAFEEGFWELDGDSLDEKIGDLFKVAAHQLAIGEERFIEGLGPCASVRTVEYKEKSGERVNVVWNDTYEDIETEVVK